LQGMTSIQVLATPMIGRDKSSSVNPTAFNIARAGARSGPTSKLWLVSFNSFGMSAYFPFFPPFFLSSAFSSFFMSVSIIASVAASTLPSAPGPQFPRLSYHAYFKFCFDHVQDGSGNA
jgi:VIT1/CCC1 family predicted Fe2+/Mn2+ transporter